MPRAMMSAFTSGDSGTLRMWTMRICSRPRMSGSGTTTWRSKRPGRISAGSSTSGRLVAAITITPDVGLEAVHLDQHLVQGLFALVVAAAEAGAALAADRVDLVDEDDAGRAVSWPARTCRARAPRPRRRTSRRNRNRRSRRTAPWPRRRWRAPAASCRCRASRPSARRAECGRRASGIWTGRAGSRPARRLLPWPLRSRPRRRR